MAEELVEVVSRVSPSLSIAGSLPSESSGPLILARLSLDVALCGGESSVSSEESARRRFARRFVFAGVMTMFEGGAKVLLRPCVLVVPTVEDPKTPAVLGFSGSAGLDAR
jgi:hypothetical protein